MASVQDRILRRVEKVRFDRLADDLDRFGHATTPRLVTATEGRRLAGLFEDDARFRKTVEMERLGFGVGRYRYFDDPLPEIVGALREALYPHLAAIANRWAKRIGDPTRWPLRFSTWQRECESAGQTAPTPLLLRYGKNGYNCLHQDRYGELAFPLQAVCTLSVPGQDYRGGAFLLVEQRPRMQSRAEAIDLEPGRFVLFPNAWRPVAGVRGEYRVQVRHGVSRVTSGSRTAFGIIFHDAAT